MIVYQFHGGASCLFDLEAQETKKPPEGGLSIDGTPMLGLT
jgi:hypothetical protein